MNSLGTRRSPDSSPQTILVVDDTPENIQFIGGVLQPLYRIRVANNGATALKVAASEPRPDLILLDVMMPDMDGYEVIRCLQATKETACIPVIFVTALEEVSNEVEGLSLGAVDYITKPIVPPLLIARVRAHLDLKQARDRLNDRNEDMERLISSTAGLGLWNFDYYTGQMAWCEEMLRLHGLSAAEFGASWSNWCALVHPDDRERFEQECEEAFRSATSLNSEFRIVRPDGQTRFHKITAVIRRDASGSATRILGNCSDVTFYRQAIEQLQEAKKAAEAANEAKSQFLANMSHELRTPLNAISGFSQLLTVTETDLKRKEQLDIITQSSNHMLRLVQDVLQYSKLKNSSDRPEYINFNLTTEIVRLIKLFEHEAAAKHIELLRNISPDVPECLRGDPGLLRQILMNLVGNALKFTEHGSVEVRIQRATSHYDLQALSLLFEVIDTGIGIRPENQSRIFNAFEQGDNSHTRRYGGVGLGLTICRQLVSSLNGEIWLESMFGVGSRFSFTALFEESNSQDLISAIPSGPLQSSLGEQPSVLVVEDDPFNLRLLIALLERLDCRVVAATDGHEALELLEEASYDLILMDIQLPGHSGDAITRRVRMSSVSGCNAHVPIIALTAYPFSGHRERFLSIGMNDCLIKPLDIVHLTELVAGYIGPRKIQAHR